MHSEEQIVIGRKKLGLRLSVLLGRGGRDEEFFEELEDILIEGDIGASTSMEIVEELRERVKTQRNVDKYELASEMKIILNGYLKIAPLMPESGRLNVFLIMGVNGVGKTTTIAKLAHYYRRNQGIENILLSAGDTFRAAAIDQLKIHAERLNLNVISQASGADPAAVIFDSISSAQSRGMELVLADTAGRMHNKADLVRELTKIDRVIKDKIGDNPYRKVLVIDATTGQNALTQVETFKAAVGVDSLILAKYDSTARGGIAIPICRRLGTPFSFMGVGEKWDDLIEFDRDRYLDSLVGLS
jgi:fused signal recognition particle receptor